MTAVSSMRLFVVWLVPPQSSRSLPCQRSSAPQPPGPGLPLQAPSVKISTASESVCDGSVMPRARIALLASPSQALHLAHHEALGLDVEPVEAHSEPAQVIAAVDGA